MIQEFPFPQFDIENYHNDVALLKIWPKINFTGTDYTGRNPIGSICLPKIDRDFIGSATVAGWGLTTSRSVTASEILMAVDVNLLEATACRSYKIFRPDLMICAGYLEGGKDACQVSQLATTAIIT